MNEHITVFIYPTGNTVSPTTVHPTTVRPTTEIEVDVEIVQEGYAELVSDDTGVWLDVHYDVELSVNDYGYNYETEDSDYELSDDEKVLAREQAYTYYWENYRHV